MEENFKERLLQFLKYLKIGQGKFESNCRIGNGTVNNIRDGISSPNLEKISNRYPELSMDWLITGKGEMLKSETPLIDEYSITAFKQHGYAPFYSDLQVSAGKYDLASIEKSEEAESYLKIPGISARAWFPVVGFSMEPKVFAGDIIGVKEVENWEKVDPDKIYMIVTHEDRMIKRLRIDNDNSEFIWCVSDNYKEFKLYTSEIKAIYHVVFVGRLV